MLPGIFKPVFMEKSALIRIGPPHDGGYVLSRNLVENIDFLISFGIGDNYDFEKHLHRLTNCVVKAYDHTIGLKYWLYRLIMVVLKFRLPHLLEPGKILAKWGVFDFFSFFGKRRVHHHLKEVGKHSPQKTSLSSIMQNVTSKNVFLKSDIEGSEYEILDEIVSYPDQIIGFVIEFHDTASHLKELENLIQSTPQYKVIHIHGNNCSDVKRSANPTVLEITFCRVDYLDAGDISRPNDTSYPVDGIDFPNISGKADIKLTFDD